MDYKDQLQAAYALNMCTVSVSQIIEYRDLEIMEQEYEGILNNLNLEEMPKDEALLKIIKQILDVITFFRIEEKDKEFLDKKYQQKMKNAIWSSAPNLGLIVAGGNLLTMAISLATQIGVSRMNYRRNKLAYELEHEQEMWQLQRSAIEQFNGLRRELFDVAWRLSAEYKFPDRFRLTEKQIKQYNEILIDTDTERKYERLDAIKDAFDAYPPFWYNFGNTAHMIACDYMSVDSEIAGHYLYLAKSHYDKYWEINEHSILRFDQTAASCALEYVELLNPDKDREQISEYLHKAEKFSGSQNDILQLCAVGYLRIGEYDSAERLMRYLVNEEYNINLNAQILSGLYVRDHIEQKSDLSRMRYIFLEKRINNSRLIPWPEEGKDFNAVAGEFVSLQRELLYRECEEVYYAIVEKYVISLNRIFPVPDERKEYGDMYFTAGYSDIRKKDIGKVLSSKLLQGFYLDRLQYSDFISYYMLKLNELYDTLQQLDFIIEPDEIRGHISDGLRISKDELNMLQEKIAGRAFTPEDYNAVQKYTNLTFLFRMADIVKAQCVQYIGQQDNMDDFSKAEANLIAICDKEKLPEPDVLIRMNMRNSGMLDVRKDTFDLSLLGEEQPEKIREAKNKQELLRLAKQEFPGILTGNKTSLLYRGDNAFREYFRKLSTFAPVDVIAKIGSGGAQGIAGSASAAVRARNDKLNDIRVRAVAVLDDKSFADQDLIFTLTGVFISGKTMISNEIAYTDISYDVGTKTLMMLDQKYTSKNIDTGKLYEVIKEIVNIL